MDRLRVVTALLLAFAVCTAAAIVVGGSRPANAPGVAPAVIQYAGYACGGVAAVLLLVRRGGGDDDAADRRVGGQLLTVFLALVLLDLVVADGSPNIGAGFVRLVLLIIVGAVAVRLVRVRGVTGQEP